MKARDGRWALICAVTAMASAPALRGQEALRTALESDAAARLRLQPVVRPSEDRLRIGPATFDVRLGYALEASDNVTFVEEGRESDLIQRPSLDIGVAYQASRQSRLTLNAGFGYEDFIEDSQEDRFFVNPGTEIAFDVRIGNSLVTVFDRLDYSQDVTRQGALSGVARFPRLENIIGLRSVWRFDKWIWQAGYSHLNVFVTEDTSSAMQETFDYLERADEQFFGRVGHAFSSTVEAGLESSGSVSDYAFPTQRDRYTITAGPFLSWTAADALEVAVRGGAAYTVFSPTNSTMEDSDLTSHYAGLQVKHRLTDYITYTFSAVHDITAGINAGADYIESTRLALAADWKMMRYLSVNAQVFAEDSEETSVEAGTGGANEKYQRIGAGGGFTYDLTKRLSLFVRYAFVVKDSDAEARSYRENRATIGATYRY